MTTTQRQLLPVPLSETQTPETDAEQRQPWNAGRVNNVLPSDFARKLERQRDWFAAEAERLRGCAEWRPMSDAPRDGTQVLLWFDGMVAHSGAYSRPIRTWIADGLGRCFPTAWLPLPPPPQESAPGRGQD